VYRSMVRAKVARIRMRQVESPEEREKAQAEYCAFVELARLQTQPPRAALIITHGFSGAGKTTCAQWMLEHTHAVRIRTDVERRRLHDLGTAAASGSNVGEGRYTTAATRQTYTHVCRLAHTVVQAGYRALVDGTFLTRWQRAMFQEAAAALGVPFVILDVSAPDATLRDRMARRRQQGGDASEATIEVLDAQLRTAEPLAAEEQPFVIRWEDR
jgi:uncharacterized protein